jgi:acetylornithine deacetylase/succinyl-diaminopimelate desuccinylase-like protein
VPEMIRGDRRQVGTVGMTTPAYAAGMGESHIEEAERRTHEVTELLQHLIRNACVNDGTAGSGGEVRSADLLADYLAGSSFDLERFEPEPGRSSLVARMEGRDPDAPTLLLMGHTDVVPVNPEGWSHDPFGAELIDGEVWGRGAVDMLNLTASMAVAAKHLADGDFNPDGTLIYLAVADEEALGTHGANWLTDHEPDAIGADFVITESGGIPIPSPTGVKLPVIVAEKGCYWCRLRVRGTPGHGSQPYGADNALVTAAEVVRRLDRFQTPAQIHDVWRRFVTSMGYPTELTDSLLSVDGFDELLARLPVGLATQFHACTHTTFAPTVAHGGTKINVIPDTVDLEVDIRTLPGQTDDEVAGLLADALGDLAGRVDVEVIVSDGASESPTDTPLWESLGRVSQAFYRDSQIVPFLTVGATDSRFFRRMGVTAYGFGMFSQHLSFEDYGRMFHGDDERIDVESLGLSVALWDRVARDLLG